MSSSACNKARKRKTNSKIVNLKGKASQETQETSFVRRTTKKPQGHITQQAGMMNCEVTFCPARNKNYPAAVLLHLHGDVKINTRTFKTCNLVRKSTLSIKTSSIKV